MLLTDEFVHDTCPLANSCLGDTRRSDKAAPSVPQRTAAIEREQERGAARGEARRSVTVFMPPAVKGGEM